MVQRKRRRTERRMKRRRETMAVSGARVVHVVPAISLSGAMTANLVVEEVL